MRCIVRTSLAAVLIGLVACADPPDKELNQAQGAIETARAAGADQYASEEFTAAVTALQRANDAVVQRDYRSALSHALDSRDRAQTAARQAGDQKAAVRGDAERTLAELEAVLAEAQTHLKAAQAARVAPRSLAAPRLALGDAEKAVQEASADLKRGNVQGALAAVTGLATRVRAASHEIETATATAAGRRRR